MSRTKAYNPNTLQWEYIDTILPSSGGGGGSVEALTDDEMIALLHDGGLFDTVPAMSINGTLYSLTMTENGVQKLLYV